MRFITGTLAGFALSTSVVYWSYLHTQRQRIRQSILLREQALILDSLHDQTVVIPEEAPISVLRTTLKRSNRHEEWKRWWNSKVEELGIWLNGGGLEAAAVDAGKATKRRLENWTSSRTDNSRA